MGVVSKKSAHFFRYSMNNINLEKLLSILKKRPRYSNGFIDSFDLGSLLIQDIESISNIEGTTTFLDSVFSINLSSLASFALRNGIKPIRKEPWKTGRTGYRNIYLSNSFIECAISSNQLITIPEIKALRLLDEVVLVSTSDQLSKEIALKNKELSNIENAISLAKSRLEIAHKKLKQTVDDDLFDHEQILVMAGIKRRLCGVYFLIKDMEVIYVGQSINIHSRIEEHERTKVFDTFTYIECPRSDLNVIEAKYINKFKPSLNYDINGRLVLPMRLAS